MQRKRKRKRKRKMVMRLRKIETAAAGNIDCNSFCLHRPAPDRE
jgi:hypothetical protein